MSDGPICPSGDDVLHHVIYAQHGTIPFGWHVYVLKDLSALRRVRIEAGGHDGVEAYAWTSMANEPQDGCIGAMYFVQGWTYVGMVAHECTHLASWICRFLDTPRRMTLGREPEKLAEIVGELTSVTWYNLTADGMATVDDD